MTIWSFWVLLQRYRLPASDVPITKVKDDNLKVVWLPFVNQTTAPARVNSGPESFFFLTSSWKNYVLTDLADVHFYTNQPCFRVLSIGKYGIQISDLTWNPRTDFASRKPFCVKTWNPFLDFMFYGENRNPDFKI